MARLFRFKPLSDTFPGLVDAGCTNFLLPTSCPPARNSNCSLIATSSFSSNYLRAWKLEFSRKRTSVSIHGRILSNRKKLWTMIRSKRTRRKNTIPETIHLFLPLNHLKRLSRIGFTANNSLARRFKVVSLTCARWYKPLCFILVSTPLEKPFRRPSSVYSSPAFAFYSQSLQARRSFFATLHPPLRAPFPPSFTSLFRHYEQFCCLSAFAFPNFPRPAAEFYFALVCRLLLPRRTLPFISVHGLSLTRDSL